MLVEVLCLISVTCFCYYLYRKGTENEDYFVQSGVKVIKPTFVLGNSADLLLQRMPIFDFVQKIYKTFPEERVTGMFDLRTPILLLRDPLLVKQLAVREFDHFVDHRIVVDESMDKLLGKSLVSLTGQKWRDMRSTLSPAFTGSKMRLMFELIVEVCEQVVVHMKEEAVTSPNGILESEMKEFCSRFTNDIIALCAFGIKVNSLKDKDNEFFTYGKDIMDFNSWEKISKFLALRFFPGPMRFFNIQLCSESLRTFFKSMIMTTLRIREENNIFRPDMINILMEVRKGILADNSTENHSNGENERTKWSDDDLIAQCFLFFLAGFDTSSTVMSFAIYELTSNPDVQKKLYNEVKTVNDKLNGNPLNYETLLSMKYLDMVVSETLRKRPPAALTDRICVKDFEFDSEDGFKFNFKKGLNLWIPIYAFHHNPQYFPNPEKFDPERFSDENKHLINPDTYMPFGVGPRNCIGARFALMEVKALIYYLTLNFSFNVTERTQIPLQFKNTLGNILTEKGVWVGLKPRT